MTLFRSRPFSPLAAFALGSTLFIASSFLSRSNPSGESVAAGKASFNRKGSTLLIKTDANTIIDWQSFSIGTGETTRFLQPSSSDVTLNRVVGSDGSSIFGSLQGNGRIILLNPNGVLIGPSGKVDTAGFMASTLNVTNEEFLKGGDLNFTGNSQASVINQGAIHAIDGDVFLIGRNVENNGSIKAPKGTVGLAAGAEVLLKQDGTERVFVKPGSTGTVTNRGQIEAVAAELKAHGNLYALAINNTGVIRATGVARQNGRVLLTGNGGTIRNSGTISARNGNQSGGQIVLDSGSGQTVNSGLLDASGKAVGAVGGAVQVLGDQVALVDFGKVDVSGNAGGGTALIGGDYHGENPLVRNATQTVVGKDASIVADATGRGDGGRVIVWSNEATGFAGTISAKGGSLGGNGGFVEVSSKNNLGFAGMVRTGASKGKDGTLLLDPLDITISGSNGADNAQITNLDPSTGTYGIAFGGTDASYSISTGALQALQGNIVLQANRDITLLTNSPLSLTHQTAGERLVLQAGRHITLSSSVTTAGADIYLEADVANDPADPGKLTINAPVSTSNGGSIQLLAASFDITSQVNSGNRHSTRITASHGNALVFGGSDANISTSDIDLLVSSYQVWVGRASSAGSNGLGGINTPGMGGEELTASSITINGASTFHSANPLLFFSEGDVNVNSPLTTSGATTFVNGSSSFLNTFRVADGASATNLKGGLGLQGFDLDLQTSGSLQGTLNIGSNGNAFPVFLGADAPNGTTDPIQVSASELQRISAPQLIVSALDADITVDGVTLANSGQIGSFTLSAGANGTGVGAIHFVNNPSTFNKLTVAANGGIDVGATLTINNGPISLYADRFGEGSGIFSNTAPVVSSANQPILVEAADVNLGAALSTTAGVTLQPSRTDYVVGIGSASGDFTVSQSELDAIGTNHASLTLGRANAPMLIGNASLGLPTLFQAQPIQLSGTVAVSGGNFPLTFRGAVVVNSNSEIDSSSGNILFTSTVTDSTGGAHILSVNASGGTVTFGSGVGVNSSEALGGLSVAASGNVTFNSSFWLTGANSVSSSSGNILFLAPINDATNGGGSLSVTTSNGSVSFQNALGSGTTALGGIDVAASGDVNFRNSVWLSGSSSVTSGTGNIAFATALKAAPLELPALSISSTSGNVSFQGAIGSGSNAFGTLAINAGQTLSLKGGLFLGGNSSLSSEGGSIVVTGAINDTAGGLSALTLDAGGGSINLGSIGATKLQALGSLTANNASSILLNSSVTTTGAQSYGSPVRLGNSIVLNSASGGVAFGSSLDSKSPSAPKALTLAAGSGSITFSGTVGASASLATLLVSSAQDISGTNALNLVGTLRLTASGDITLPNPSNSFGALTVIGNNVDIAKSGTLTISGATAAGNLSVESTATITQTGVLAVNGDASFSGSTVTLSNAGNRLKGAVSLNSTSDATLANATPTVLGDSNVGRTLTVTSKGAITQTGVANVAGLAKFVALGTGTAGTITLDQANSFGWLQLTAVNAAVTEADSMNLAGVTVSKSLALNSGGTITQISPLSVSGTFSATAADAITLENNGNAFYALGDISRGGALSLLDSKSGLTLTGNITGGTTDNAVKIVVSSGPLLIAGPARTAISGNAITLATPGIFTNLAGATALELVNGGRFLIYCHGTSNFGGLPYDWIERYVSYPISPSAQHSTGNGVMLNN